ncbi:MAG: DUF3300 domain-containing protein [Methylobacterium sp.]|nr:DUF3300 domain-containing protein [Methylobacterium sp.]
MSTGNSLISICGGSWVRIAVVILFTWTSTIYPVLAQTATPPAPVPTGEQPATAAAPPADAAAPELPLYSMSDLEFLLGPIALFPDPLLMLTLQAATLPEQVDEADLWIVNNPAAVARRNFTVIDAKEWDPSVKALSRFPDVIELLARNLDWSQSVGAAFARQPDAVAATIQLLRAKAKDLGNLKTTKQQVVTVREENSRQIIYIAPANPVRIYVPVYDPATVFVAAVPLALAFGVGVLVGSSWNHRWGWNNRRWNTVWVVQPGWRPPPPTWRPGPGRPGVRPPGVWRPDRPGDRPSLPNRPERPNRPETRPNRPDRPNVRPDRPGTRPNIPNRPETRPNRPEARPQRPAARPQRPETRPNRPAARPEQRPAPRSDRVGGSGRLQGGG